MLFCQHVLNKETLILEFSCDLNNNRVKSSRIQLYSIFISTVFNRTVFDLTILNYTVTVIDRTVYPY